MVSYKIAKLLKENGWTKKTIQKFPLETPGIWEFKHFFYAPSLEELLEELPPVSVHLNLNDENKDHGKWLVMEEKRSYAYKSEFDDNPCDAAARLWIELKGVRSVKQ